MLWIWIQIVCNCVYSISILKWLVWKSGMTTYAAFSVNSVFYFVRTSAFIWTIPLRRRLKSIAFCFRSDIFLLQSVRMSRWSVHVRMKYNWVEISWWRILRRSCMPKCGCGNSRISTWWSRLTDPPPPCSLLAALMAPWILLVISFLNIFFSSRVVGNVFLIFPPGV